MPARLDPFLDVFLREQAEQLYLLPDEPVTMVKDGKPRKVSKQPLTDAHIYALLAEIAPSESADQIDQKHETEFEYAAGRGLLKIRIVPDNGRLTAVVTNVPRAAPPPPPPPTPAEVTTVRPGVRAAATPPPAPAAAPAPPPRPPRPSAIAAAPMVEAPVATPAAGAAAGLPGEFADSQYQAAEQRLGELLKALVKSGSSDLHLRVGEPPIFRTGGDLVRVRGNPLSPAELDLLVLAIMPELNRGEWKETGDTDFAYEISGLARFRVNAARDRRGPVAVFRVIPAKVVTVDDVGRTEEGQALSYLTNGPV